MGTGRLRQVMLIAAITGALSATASIIVGVMTKEAGGPQWAWAIGVTIITTVLTALVKLVGAARESTSSLASEGVVPLVVALGFAALIAGVGVFHVPSKVQSAFKNVKGYVTGNESGPEQLAKSAEARIGHWELKVNSVERTPHFTRVRAELRNYGSE